MRKLREVMRLRFELHLGYQQIGRSCAIGVSTVCKYLQRAEAAGVSWPLPEDWDEARVEAALFPARSTGRDSPARSQPDFATIHEQLRQHRHLTLQLLWEEYRQANPEAIVTRASASCTSVGDRSSTWCCDRSTRPARRCSSIGRARRFRCTTGIPAWRGKPRCSWPRWAPAATPGPRRRAISRWNRGCALTCMRSNTSAAFRRWRFPITPRPA